jgi:uncharacterized protein (DUF1501 family)
MVMAVTKKPPTLVVLQFTGGNDTLNTVIPYANPLYYDNRPNVRVNEADVLKIDDQYGFHPSMAAIKPFWDEGKMAVINGVGYPDPNYSHFRSMDIWYTAEPSTIATDATGTPASESARGSPRPKFTALKTISALGSRSRTVLPSQPSVAMVDGSAVYQMSIERKCE